jgi:hypothetical protein
MENLSSKKKRQKSGMSGQHASIHVHTLSVDSISWPGIPVGGAAGVSGGHVGAVNSMPVCGCGPVFARIRRHHAMLPLATVFLK